ncbi:MAG: hypothetical protein ABW007_18985 [Chitinophagaceae bacterium]
MNNKELYIRFERVCVAHKEWELTNFGVQPILRSVKGIMEEQGELMHCVLKFEQGIRGMDADKYLELGKDAIADIGIYLISAINKTNTPISFFTIDACAVMHGVSIHDRLCSDFLDAPDATVAPNAYREFLQKRSDEGMWAFRNMHAATNMLFYFALQEKLDRVDVVKADWYKQLANECKKVLNAANDVSLYLFGVPIMELISEVWDREVSKREWKARKQQEESATA